jgi:putative ABC transport system substrate-binding protein
MVLRFAAGDPERARKFAVELVEMAPDLIVCHTTPAAAALHEATRALPIVFVSITDPVADGFVGNIARPGGNMTGFTNYDFVMGAKWLEILKEIAPGTTRVVVLLNPEVGSYYAGYLQSIEAAARAQSVVATSAVIRQPDDIDSAIAALGGQPGAGLIFPPSAPITAHQRRIIELTAQHRVPAIYPFGYFAKQGGLAAYGTDLDDLFLRAGGYVDRILRGEKPADLPVQAPTKFELVINLKTARALGLTVPQLLLAQADEVIE